MAKQSDTKKVIGFVLLGLGIGLGIWGFNQSGTFGAQLTEAVTGSQTDQVLYLYIGAAACILVGLFLVSRK